MRCITVRWYTTGNQADLIQWQILQQLLRTTQMAMVNRIEGTTKDTDHSSRKWQVASGEDEAVRGPRGLSLLPATCDSLLLFPYMSVAEHDIFQ